MTSPVGLLTGKMKSRLIWMLNWLTGQRFMESGQTEHTLRRPRTANGLSQGLPDNRIDPGQSSMLDLPTLYVASGPNGCGKSTLTRTKWLNALDIIDPDAIARAIGSGTDLKAGRKAITRRQKALRIGSSHLLETTLSGTGVLRHMEAARTAGFRIELLYVCVKSPDLPIDRIRTRVASGGHYVPEADVRRRFFRSLDNLPVAIARSDEARLYDNTDHNHPHREIATMVGTNWWTAECLPVWAETAITQVPNIMQGTWELEDRKLLEFPV